MKALTTEDAATYLGCKPSTLRKWRLLKIGPKYRRYNGKRLIRYDEEDLKQWIDRQPTGGETMGRRSS